MKVLALRGMNKLPEAKRALIFSMLCEGSSMRSISRIVDVSINTVSALLVDAGKGCAEHHDRTVHGLVEPPSGYDGLDWR